jgi:hypothetical protein
VAAQAQAKSPRAEDPDTRVALGRSDACMASSRCALLRAEHACARARRTPTRASRLAVRRVYGLVAPLRTLFHLLGLSAVLNLTPFVVLFGP